MTGKHKKPVPDTPEAGRKICPVCNQSSYSAAGIHPQCAAVQADAPRSERLKAAKKAEGKKKTKQQSTKQRSWSKKCPQCHAEVHVRRKLCDCGHAFS